MNLDIDKSPYQEIIKDNMSNPQSNDTNICFIYNKNYKDTCVNLGLNPLMSSSNYSTPLNRPSEPFAIISKPQHVDLSGNVTRLDNPIK